MRRTYVLTWNPSKWTHWEGLEEYSDEVRQTSLGRVYPTQWSCGNTQRIAKGDRVFLMRQKSQRGLIGSGIVTRGSFWGAHWNGVRGEKALYVKYDSDTLLEVDDRLPVERLREMGMEMNWNQLQSSGQEVPSQDVSLLEAVWLKHLLRVGRSVRGNDIRGGTEITGENGHGTEDEQVVDRVVREIIQRRGQWLFRERLMVAYGGRCAISDCNARAALEAAHVRPYASGSSNRVSDGILLRSDLHTLFDLQLIAVDPKRLTVAVASELRGTDYHSFHGVPVREPEASGDRLDITELRRRWSTFKSNDAKSAARSQS